jgi:hypothetical protein
VVKNGKETDVDCGGGVCTKCVPGKVCSLGADCTSAVCKAGLCQAPTCSDATKNGTETGVDCGGGACATCPAGQGCGAGTDCQSGVCTGGVCQAPTCTDKAKNGAETDVDCGGTCGGCAVGKVCAINSDCASGLACKAGVCISITPPATGLVGYWNFEQAAPQVLDQSGNNNHGTANATAVQIAGKVGKGYTFVNGSCIGIPDSASLSMVGGATLTMMAWVNYAGGCSSDRGEILNKENTYEMAPQCGATPFFQEAIQASDGNWFWTGATPLTLNTWQLATVTWDGTTVREYINGVPAGTRAMTGSFADRATGLGIGCRSVSADGNPNTGSSFFIGGIDEVSVYNRALSQAEIQAYYDATK